MKYLRQDHLYGFPRGAPHPVNRLYDAHCPLSSCAWSLHEPVEDEGVAQVARQLHWADEHPGVPMVTACS